MAFASETDVSSHYTTNSQLYRFNGSMFVSFQSVPTKGAYDFEFFTLDNQNYLAVANGWDDALATYSTNSQIFKYDGTSFVPFLSIPTVGARDWTYFTMNSRAYVVVANYASGTSTSETTLTSSSIYRLSRTCLL